MKTDPTFTAARSETSPADWEVLRGSRTEDYDGHTGFDRMTPAARLAWLEAAADFVSRNSKRFPNAASNSDAPSASTP